MKKTINTNNGIVLYEEQVFSCDKDPMDAKVATNNLIDAKRVLDKHNVKYGLMFGTLLGAIRENNLIEHDKDIDLFMLEEDKGDLLNSLPDLIKDGFEIGRYNDNLLTIIKDSEYIDFYFFRKSYFYYRKCDVGLTAKSKYLENTEDYTLFGETFQIPINAEKLLIDLYGKKWRVPVINDPSMNHNKYIILREGLRNRVPKIYSVLIKIKTWFT